MSAGTTARHFPLVARSRPACTALPARIGALADLAAQADRDNDPTAAARVHNQAALIASDCDQHELARTWCHRHAHAWLHHDQQGGVAGRRALEPLVNLARLHIRAGDHDDGFTLLNTLYQAVACRADTVIDDIPVPATALTHTPETHHDLVRWLWSVLLADGTRALTSAGRWDEAEQHLQRHKGIGHRMLDGRQVAIVARLHRHQHAAAQRLIDDTQPGEAWETAVTACLAGLGHPPTPTRIDRMTRHYHLLDPSPTQIVFRTRLALSIIELSGGVKTTNLEATMNHAVNAAIQAADGYAARDILTHREWSSTLRRDHYDPLAKIVEDSALGSPMPPRDVQMLTTALLMSEAVIARTGELPSM
ncbi:hypothetical protein ACIG87_24050 [Micromonospora sp. NPDC051925]|uniref:hypothetical protein n=1 Tax=Micromonospora sp. NPDC051925 TaxID=3364288 RepID=UPI0037CBE4CD